MKVATVSTLWDYINRAMPWNAPKSLKPDEVYAVTAYLLNLGGIVPADFTLSDKNIAEVQKRMPNRNGMTTDHAMWPGNEFGAGKVKPDVQAKACMSHCEVPQDVPRACPRMPTAPRQPAEQNRLVGPQRGAVTVDAAKSGAAKPSAADPLAAAVALTQKNGCTACHGMTTKLVGPGFAEVAEVRRPGRLPGGQDRLGRGRVGQRAHAAQTLSPTTPRPSPPGWPRGPRPRDGAGAWG
jgi:cytochrome c